MSKSLCWSLRSLFEADTLWDSVAWREGLMGVVGLLIALSMRAMAWDTRATAWARRAQEKASQVREVLLWPWGLPGSLPETSR